MIKVDENMNDNFNLALEMSEKTPEYDEIIKFLSCDSVAVKQIAALKLSELRSKNDALILCKNLVGQDGKIREVVALKINELIKIQTDLFSDENIFDIFLEGIIDVNANVCREIIESVCFLKDVNKSFCEYFCPRLLDKIRLTLAEIEKFNFRTKKFVISKKMFNLYWALEVLGEFWHYIEFKDLKQILLKTGEMQDYTIREKTAKILSMNSFDDIDLNNLAQKLKQDENYYVRRF